MPLQESDVTLKTLKSYSGYDVPFARLPVIITKGDGVALMVRDWLSTLKLNWKEISLVYQTNFAKLKLEDLMQKYLALFDGKLGTIEGVTAKLVVKENATPLYFKPHPVPYALRDQVAADLSRL